MHMIIHPKTQRVGSLPAMPITLAPSALAIWHATSPTAPEAPETQTTLSLPSPLGIPRISRIPAHAVTPMMRFMTAMAPSRGMPLGSSCDLWHARVSLVGSTACACYVHMWHIRYNMCASSLTLEMPALAITEYSSQLAHPAMQHPIGNSAALDSMTSPTSPHGILSPTLNAASHGKRKLDASSG